MEVEQLEIRDYLAKCPPLTELSTECLNEVAQGLEIQYARRGTDILKSGGVNQHSFLIRSGAVEVFLPNGELYGRFGEGEWVGYRSVMRGGTVSMDVQAIEDTLLYAIPGELFRRILGRFERVHKYFTDGKPERLRRAIQEIRGADDGFSMITLHVRDLMKLPMLVARDMTIQQVARQMGEVNAQTAMVIEADASLSGIVTDVDFRRRVVAEGLDVHLPIADIMTPNPLVLSPREQVSEALLLMARRNIRHVPVVDGGDVVGVISASDLLRSQSHNAVYLVGDIFAAKDPERLAELSKVLPKVLVGLVRNSLPANDIGQAITSIGQAIARRLLALGEEKLGSPPVPYAFVAAGSLARREQTAHSDQDNGMILSDEYNEAEHGEYFRNLARFVSDGLDACGYVYCPGNVMATNDQWRQPLAVWRGYFDTWIQRPEAKALMYSSIFFDLRCLHGDESLLLSLQEEVLRKTKASTLFQAFMASNALSHRPPLGFFRGFVLDKDKDGSDETGMDMKKRGVVPVIDLARVFALAGGLAPINTWERLDAIADEGALLSPPAVNDLRDAFEFISMVRLQHQAKQIEKGQSPNNTCRRRNCQPWSAVI
jgi:CBS domain-containing protein